MGEMFASQLETSPTMVTASVRPWYPWAIAGTPVILDTVYGALAVKEAPSRALHVPLLQFFQQRCVRFTVKQMREKRLQKVINNPAVFSPLEGRH